MKWYLYMLGVGLFFLTNVTSGKTEIVPQGYQTDIKLNVISSSEIQVNWTRLSMKLIKHKSKLTGYILQYKAEGESGFKRVNVGMTTIKTLINLVPFKSYTVFVEVVNGKHYLGWTKHLTAKTQTGVPRRYDKDWIELSALSSTSIQVKWRSPSQSLVNGLLTGYKIKYQPKKVSPKIIDVGLVTNYTIRSLQKYTLYYIQIAVNNTKYTGPWSGNSYAVTLADAPDCPPNGISVQAVSSKSIRITWSPLKDTNKCKLNGVLKGYKVNYRLNRDGSRMMYQNVSSSTTITVVTGLYKYTEYSFQVLAYTTKHGPLSKAIVQRTKEDAPDCPPNGISVQAVSSKSIRITWSPLKDTNKCRLNGVLRGYRVTYRLNRQSRMMYKFAYGSGATTRTVAGLEKYTEYSFQVLAYTTKHGPLSKAISQRTKEDAPDCPPNGISVQAVSSKSIRITWSPLKDTNKCRLNGVLRGYRVTYRLNRQSRMMYKFAYGSGATTRTVAGLEKYTEYSFQVLAYTTKHGPLSKAISQRTKEDAPDCPPNGISVQAVSSKSIRITWSPLKDTNNCRLNGVLRGYRVAYRLNRQSRMMYKFAYGSGATTRTVAGLEKYTEYSFQVQAYTSKYGLLSTAIVKTTKEDEPDGAPQQVAVSKINITSYQVTWTPVHKNSANGIITKYEVNLTLVRIGKIVYNNHSIFHSRKAPLKLEYVIHGLTLCAQYNVSVRAFTGKGPGPYSKAIPIVTQRPGPPKELNISRSSKTEFKLTWKKPDGVSSVLAYNIKQIGYKSYWSTFSHTKRYTSRETTTFIKNLTCDTEYQFLVHVTTVCGNSPNVNTSTKTERDYPIAPDVTAVEYHNKSKTVVNVTLWVAKQLNGEISAYQVIVSRGPSKLFPNYTDTLFNHTTAVQEGLSYYITAELPKISDKRVITIGDGSIFKHKYVNVPLYKGYQYFVYQRAVAYYTERTLHGKEALVAYIRVASDHKGRSDTGTANSTGPGGAIGAVLGVIIVLCIVITGAFFWRKRQRQLKVDKVQLNVLPTTSAHNGGLGAASNSLSHSIPVESFPAYISQMKTDNHILLRSEYKSVPNHHSPSTVAKKPENKFKNRYGNIIAYDHSRVPIDKVKGDENSDYINASYIRGCTGQSPKKYIATQGPMIETFDEFWRMIWEQNIQAIVMLTNLLEVGKRKCHQYWPDESDQYADIQVSNHKTEVFVDYVIRTFNVTKGGRTRHVLQYHFIAWPDKSVPQHTMAILSFRKKVCANNVKHAVPTVVHCSAGVGRTGAYIMIDALLEQAEKENCVDALSLLHSLREDRPNMVQTEEQYIFVYTCLYEAIYCGNTEIQVHNLRIATQKLAAVDREQNASGYSLEFKKLCEVTSQESADVENDVGKTKANVKKNRYRDVIPVNKYRVVLKIENEGEENYINATFVDTYRERNAFIVTQAPLQNTLADFWKMVMDYDIGTIVMLNNLQELEETFIQYWPKKGTSKYGEVTVELLSADELVGFVSRKLKVTKEETTRTIDHFQHVNWVDKCVPANQQSVLELLGEVQRSQHRCANAPILVQCSNGVGRSGTFCAVASTLERVKQEQVLDVFQTVKLIRTNRPGAVQTLTQYVFCYQIVQKYLDSFSDYANFSA